MLFERIFISSIGIACFVLLFIAWGFVAPIAYDPLGPRPYPVLLLSLLVISCIYLVFRPRKFADTVDVGFLNPLIFKKVCLTLLFFFIYAVTFEFLGFILSTTIMCFAIGILFGGNKKASLISAISLSVFCYLMFDYGLDVPLPLGFFFSK
jgi:putative tricarboxylic transport membrane protein